MRGSRLSRGSRSGFATGGSRFSAETIECVVLPFGPNRADHRRGRGRPGRSRDKPLRRAVSNACAWPARSTRIEQFLPGGDELVDAFGFQDVEYVVEVDAEGLQAGEHRRGLGVGALDRVAGDDAVVGDGGDGLLRGGVDGVRGDEVDDVAGVVVLGVLDAGGRPQRSLLGRALGGQRRPPVPGEGLLVGLVGQPGVGDRGLAPECLRFGRADRLESLVNLGVHPGDEERGDGVDLAQVVAGLGGLFQAGQVGVHDGLVPVEGEDQGDVDADALGDDGGDRGQPGQGGRDLDQHVGSVDDLVQFGGLVDGGLGFVGQARVDLDGDAAVDVAGGLVDAGEQVAGVAYVVGGGLPDGVVDGGASGGQVVELLLVGGAVGEGGLEDRRVGGDPADVPGVDQLLQVAGLQALAGQVVQPQGHPLTGQIGQRVGGVLRGGHDRCPFLSTGWADAGEQVSCGRGRAPGSPRRRGPARRRAARCSVRVPGSRRPARPWPRRRSPRP